MKKTKKLLAATVAISTMLVMASAAHAYPWGAPSNVQVFFSQLGTPYWYEDAGSTTTDETATADTTTPDDSTATDDSNTTDTGTDITSSSTMSPRNCAHHMHRRHHHHHHDACHNGCGL